MTPLHVAAAMGHAEAVQTLLAVGAVLDAQDARGRTPLILAASYKRVEVVRSWFPTFFYGGM